MCNHSKVNKHTHTHTHWSCTMQMLSDTKVGRYLVILSL